MQSAPLIWRIYFHSPPFSCCPSFLAWPPWFTEVHASKNAWAINSPKSDTQEQTLRLESWLLCMNRGLSLISNREISRWNTHEISVVNRFASYFIKTKMLPFIPSYWLFSCNKNFGVHRNYGVCNPHHKKTKINHTAPKTQYFKNGWSYPHGHGWQIPLYVIILNIIKYLVTVKSNSWPKTY